MRGKLRVVAIAKDEAAYLPEWIHHHLFVGFDEIHIYLNRTTDNSLEVLKKISSYYPQVKILSADWIDMLSDDGRQFIQHIVYAKAFDEAKSSGEIDYVLFIDIDEFLAFKDMSLKVHHYLEHLNYPTRLVFQWFHEDGGKPFTMLASKVEGKLHIAVKSMVSCSANIVKINLHYSELSAKDNYFVDGDLFEPLELHSQVMDKKCSKMRDVMVIHRVNRSEVEYMSSLARKSPAEIFPLKYNRHGYNSSVGSVGQSVFEMEGFKQYANSRNEFFALIDIESEVQTAREFVMARAAKARQAAVELINRDRGQIVRIFQGVTEPSIKVLVEKHKQVLNDQINIASEGRKITLKEFINAINSKDAFVLRDAAIHWEEKSLLLAYFFMRLAKMFRPNGPIINRKLEMYAKRFAKRMGIIGGKT